MYFVDVYEQVTWSMKECWYIHNIYNQQLSNLYHDDWSTISIQLCLYTGHHICQISLYILHIGCGLKPIGMLTVKCHFVRKNSPKQELPTRVKIYSHTSWRVHHLQSIDVKNTAREEKGGCLFGSLQPNETYAYILNQFKPQWSNLTWPNPALCNISYCNQTLLHVSLQVTIPTFSLSIPQFNNTINLDQFTETERSHHSICFHLRFIIILKTYSALHDKLKLYFQCEWLFIF